MYIYKNGRLVPKGSCFMLNETRLQWQEISAVYCDPFLMHHSSMISNWFIFP